MASSLPILNADRSRACVTALGILCLFMCVHACLLMRVVIVQPETKAPQPKKADADKPLALLPPLSALAAPVSISPPPVGQLAPVSPPSPPVEAAPISVGSFGPPPIGSFQAPMASANPPPVSLNTQVPQRLAAAPPPLQTSLKPAATAVPAKVGDPAASMALPEMIDLAKQVRGLGDMQGALEVLKRADLQFPASPEVVAEMAQSYEQMGLTDKAAVLWKQIESMDPARAAGFADLAKRKLTSPGLDAAPMVDDAGVKSLSLGACQAVRDSTVTNGEKVVLQIPILRQGNSIIDPAQVDIDVYFFDRVNGEKVAQTIADEPVSHWGAPPVDWAGLGEEPLNVSYFLPSLTPGEIAAHGRRSYHGYVVRLYYQNKLQDVASEPRDLLDFGASQPPVLPGGVNPLLPPVSN